MSAIKPKYRTLSLDELQELEKEFIDFLVVNGVIADDWERLKLEKPEKAEDMLVLFSDVVFEGILRKVQFLEFCDKDKIHCFQCLDQKMILVGLEAPAGVDLMKEDLSSDQKDLNLSFKIFQSEKNYIDFREIEIFRLLEKGAVMSDGKMFKRLSILALD